MLLRPLHLPTLFLLLEAFHHTRHKGFAARIFGYAVQLRIAQLTQPRKPPTQLLLALLDRLWSIVPFVAQVAVEVAILRSILRNRRGRHSEGLAAFLNSLTQLLLALRDRLRSTTPFVTQVAVVVASRRSRPRRDSRRAAFGGHSEISQHVKVASQSLVHSARGTLYRLTQNLNQRRNPHAICSLYLWKCEALASY